MVPSVDEPEGRLERRNSATIAAARAASPSHFFLPAIGQAYQRLAPPRPAGSRA